VCDHGFPQDHLHPDLHEFVNSNGGRKFLQEQAERLKIISPSCNGDSRECRTALEAAQALRIVQLQNMMQAEHVMKKDFGADELVPFFSHAIAAACPSWGWDISCLMASLDDDLLLNYPDLASAVDGWPGALCDIEHTAISHFRQANMKAEFWAQVLFRLKEVPTSSPPPSSVPESRSSPQDLATDEDGSFLDSLPARDDSTWLRSALADPVAALHEVAKREKDAWVWAYKGTYREVVRQLVNEEIARLVKNEGTLPQADSGLLASQSSQPSADESSQPNDAEYAPAAPRPDDVKAGFDVSEAHASPQPQPLPGHPQPSPIKREQSEGLQSLCCRNFVEHAALTIELKINAETIEAQFSPTRQSRHAFLSRQGKACAAALRSTFAEAHSLRSTFAEAHSVEQPIAHAAATLACSDSSEAAKVP